MPLAMTASQTLHSALEKLLGIAELFEHERDVHFRLPRKPIAAAVDTVLADKGERVGQQIERHRQTAARRTQHRFMTFERVVMFLEYGHS